MFKNLLIEDWKSAWKYFSMWGVALVLAWAQLSPEHQAGVASLFGLTANQVLGLLALGTGVGRMVNQRAG